MLYFLDKNGGVWPKTAMIPNKAWTFILYPTTHVLKVSAHVSLKSATKSSFRFKEILKFSIIKSIFLNSKWSSATRKIGVSFSNFASLYYVQLHIFWKYVHAFNWKQSPKVLLAVKKFRKLRFLHYFPKKETVECNQNGDSDNTAIGQ